MKWDYAHPNARFMVYVGERYYPYAEFFDSYIEAFQAFEKYKKYSNEYGAYDVVLSQMRNTLISEWVQVVRDGGIE